MSTSTVPPTLTRTTPKLRRIAVDALQRCGAHPTGLPGTGTVDVRTPITGEVVLTLPRVGAQEVEAAIETAHEAFLA